MGCGLHADKNADKKKARVETEAGKTLLDLPQRLWAEHCLVNALDLRELLEFGRVCRAARDARLRGRCKCYSYSTAYPTTDSNLLTVFVLFGQRRPNVTCC